tara:strand:- start:3092 stop:3790 length:699 start_codon:yes stop_codon:yes gene_type:complete
MKVVFIIPCFNALKNIDTLVSSLSDQKDDRWQAIFIDDISEDNTWNKLSKIDNNKISIVKNTEKKFALKNIVSHARLYQDREDVIIAVIDGDDSLCNENTVSHLINAYNQDSDVVWTAHSWDINGMNISKPMPQNVDPYSWPWCSSHLRTFKSSILSRIKDENFKDTEGEWFERGYDQALMLPVLYISKSRKYIPEVCYRYNINSVSIKDRSWEEKKQHSTVNIVRSRGFLK